ncbi:MAG TPA: hypothetical protein VF720_10470 [Candidatus Eisenbacteria bacterium]
MPRAASVVALLLLLGASGCSEDSREGSTSFRGYYPLEIGNRWEYDRELTLEFYPDDPNSQPFEYGPVLAQATREIVGDAEQDGRDYRDVEYVIHEDGFPEVYVSHEYHRQERAGHYVAYPPIDDDEASNRLAHLEWRAPMGPVAPTDAARRALVSLDEKRAAFHRAMRAAVHDDDVPGTPPDGEGFELDYPLYRGSSWIVRPVDHPFLITREVVGMERVEFPVGVRLSVVIRQDLPHLFGPNDHATFWYGRDGLYGYHLHLEAAWIDGGRPVGTYTSDESERLSAIHLVVGND